MAKYSRFSCERETCGFSGELFDCSLYHILYRCMAFLRCVLACVVQDGHYWRSIWYTLYTGTSQDPQLKNRQERTHVIKLITIISVFVQHKFIAMEYYILYNQTRVIQNVKCNKGRTTSSKT